MKMIAVTSDKSKYRRRSRQRHESEETSHRPRQTPEPQHHAKDDDSDSDPLNDLIGPAPPPKHRGRGTIGGAASLDRRFSDTYNPNADIEIMDCDADDWDESVELYRDRHKLRLHQAQRLRAAGFTEDQVRSMEDGVAKTAADRAEKTEKDVVWSKAGERRAWDQGKVLDDDGDGDDDDDGDDDELDRPRTLFSEFG
ncbi:hypothetical protein CDD83_9871 [Cordyceps sp. RAO-2017]|nr:hypothetical protein CDD83_9871 [Cordyceps sp. RAO-2017]